MENEINWCSACQVCTQKADLVNNQCGEQIVFTKQDPIKTIEYVTVPAGRMEYGMTALSVTLGSVLVATLIVGYALWSRLTSIVENYVEKKYGSIEALAEKKLIEIAKNFTFEEFPEFDKKRITIKINPNG